MSEMLRKWLYKIQYLIYFVRIENKEPVIVKRKKYKVLPEKVKMGNKTYLINREKPNFRLENKKIYYINIESGNSFVVETENKEKVDKISEKENGLTAEQIDVIIGNEILRQIAKGVLDNKKEKLFYLFIGVGVGLLLGLLIMNMYMQNKIEELNQTITDLLKDQIPVGW